MNCSFSFHPSRSFFLLFSNQVLAFPHMSEGWGDELARRHLIKTRSCVIYSRQKCLMEWTRKIHLTFLLFLILPLPATCKVGRHNSNRLWGEMNNLIKLNHSYFHLVLAGCGNGNSFEAFLTFLINFLLLFECCQWFAFLNFFSGSRKWKMKWKSRPLE